MDEPKKSDLGKVAAKLTNKACGSAAAESVEPRPTEGFIRAARAVAGFLAVANVVGMLFFSGLSPLFLAYGFLGISALGAFCAVPRKWLHRFWAVFALLAAVTIGITGWVAYGDITLVGGADYGALVLRGLEVGILFVMLVEALNARAGNNSSR